MQKYFSEKERYQLEILLKEKKPVKEIAVLLGKCKATIYNEIKRGQVTLIDTNLKEYTVYKADVSQRKYEENKIDKGRPYKVGNDLDFVKYVMQKIQKEKYSPCAVLADIRNNNLQFKTKVCFKTIYNYIKNGVFLGLTGKSLPMPRKGARKGSRRVTVALNNVRSRSIDERSQSVNDRELYGDWEMDTVVSGHGSLYTLLVLTERKSRFEIVRKMADKTMKSVCGALDDIERKLGADRFKETFHTITMDNGVEFLNIEGIEKSCLDDGKRTTTYYCHPYSSWERGSNENANKMIRRWIPKGADIGSYSDEYISYIQKWMNNYPRKLFDYVSSNDYLKSLNVRTSEL